MVKRLDIFKSDPNDIAALLENAFIRAKQEAVDRAAEIVMEEFENFKDEAGSNGISGILGDIEVTQEVNRRRIRGVTATHQIRVTRTYVPLGEYGEPYDPNFIYGVLDGGRPSQPMPPPNGRAWRFNSPRNPEFGNQRMTSPNSIDFRPAISNEEVAFVGGLNTFKLPARNFTKLIFERAKKRIDDEDLGVSVVIE